ncbi:DUF2279 domain-containing protein [Pseudoflavitalea sp. G-6-1-2]|uniref:DUF2279 domain-containing protein n=1 Tax=Pseudoflavitalea sp. G-6-1-2 TaxID=2728841 RepID=UPI00146CD00A|nr:DUF2279 domain-containing protein [Pseudoflavitalea sp. G-6-1-2]NML21464.1 DUF2279 domain-containing protein [Pseudoflavitalea sp. G-6-1-2]
MNPKSWRTTLLLMVLLAANIRVSGQMAARPPEQVMPQVDTPKIVNPDAGRYPYKPAKVYLIAGTQAALWVGSFITLNQVWYKDYPKTNFHFFNDNKEWLQMDKAGHAWTAYQMSRLSTELWNWSGLNRRKSAWLGGLSAMAYQSVIEIQDGYSSEWGFSWGDMAANSLGAATFVAQELHWNTQRIQFKLSYNPYDYPTQELKNRRNQLFGKSLQERMLKDYNSQTYWLSVNLRSFAQESKLPLWLNVAVGYGARGMLGGEENFWKDKSGRTFGHPEIERTRHFYLSADLDLTRIRTKKKWLKTILFAANSIKIPAPTLELGSNGKIRGHLFYW